MIGQPRLVAKKQEITLDMWGKLGRITEVREASLIHKDRWGHSYTKPGKLYFLRFIVPNRCTGLWLSEEQMEIPFAKQ